MCISCVAVQITGRPLFRRDAASKPMDHSSNAQGPVPTPPQNSPPKRVISQKALLSRQPLSSQSSSVKKKGSRKEITPSSSDKDGNSGRGEASYEAISYYCANYLSHPQVSRVISYSTSFGCSWILVYFCLPPSPLDRLNTHTHAHPHTHACMHACMHALMHMHTHMHAHPNM